MQSSGYKAKTDVQTHSRGPNNHGSLEKQGGLCICKQGVIYGTPHGNH